MLNLKNFSAKEKILSGTFFFWLFIAFCAAIFLISPNFGPIDDYAFLKTLQSGKPLIQSSPDFPYFNLISLGRFMPLTSMEYNLAAIFSNTTFSYFLLHAIEFILFIVLFIKLLKKTTGNKKIIYPIIIALILLPAFTLSWYKLQLPERNVSLLFVIFLLAYILYAEKRKMAGLFTALIAANLAIYYKEISFIAIGAFSFFRFVFAQKEKQEQKTKILDALLIASSALYLTLYYFIVYRHSSLLYLPSHSLLGLIKNILNYGFFSDPIIILILFPMAFWRLYLIFIKKERSDLIYDPMLMSAAAYASAFPILNVYSPYYMLPAYILAIPALIRFFRNFSLKTLPIFFKITFGATAFLMVFNTIPSGIHYLTYNKYMSANFNKTVDFLVGDINSRKERDFPTKPSIFLAGVDQQSGRGNYLVLDQFLEFKGLSINKFDMKSLLPSEEPFPKISKIQPDLTVFKAGPAYSPQKGDYVIVGPQRTEEPDWESLKNNYKLVFETKSPLAVPDINLKTLIKFYLSKRESNNLVVNDNLLNWPDYYVFLKK